MQAAACQWRGQDFSAAGLAELAWALASCGQPLSPACRQLLCSALGDDGGGGGASDNSSSTGSVADGEPAAADQQRRQPQQQRDWEAWFAGAPASRVVLLLWAAARLQCTPCAGCLEAAAAALLRGQGPSHLPAKSLVTLLWALATLRAAQQPALQAALAPLLRAATLRLAERIEAHLGPAGSWDAEGWPSPSLSLSSGEGLGAVSSEEESDDGSALGSTMDDAEAEAEAAAATARASSGEQGAAVAWFAGPSHAVASRDWQAAGGAGPDTAAAELPTASLTTAVWACGQLRHSDQRMLRAAATMLHGRVHTMPPSDLSR